MVGDTAFYLSSPRGGGSPPTSLHFLLAKEKSRSVQKHYTFQKQQLLAQSIHLQHRSCGSALDPGMQGRPWQPRPSGPRDEASRSKPSSRDLVTLVIKFTKDSCWNQKPGQGFGK